MEQFEPVFRDKKGVRITKEEYLSKKPKEGEIGMERSKEELALRRRKLEWKESWVLQYCIYNASSR